MYSDWDFSSTCQVGRDGEHLPFPGLNHTAMYIFQTHGSCYSPLIGYDLLFYCSTSNSFGISFLSTQALTPWANSSGSCRSHK